MDNIDLHDYEIEDNDPYTSDFLNQVVSDFSNNIVSLYVDYKALVKRYTDFVTNMNTGLDWLTSQVSVMSSGTYTVSGYSDPVDLDNIHVDKLFGEIYLQDFNVESKIGRYTNNYGIVTAYNSNSVYYYNTDTSTWVEDSDMLKFINNKDDIWSKTHSSDELYIDIITSTVSDYKANIIELFPFAGTLIKTIEYKTSSGTYEEIEVNSKLPVKILGDFSYSSEFRVKLGGVSSGDGQYYYSLRYVDIYRADFMDSGTVTYDIGSYDTINSITLNDDYAEDDIKLLKPIRIEILSDDESYTYYDSNVDPFPIQSAISIEVEPVNLRLRLTLYKKEGVTPVVKFIDIE
jgi:hypothetical protein